MKSGPDMTSSSDAGRAARVRGIRWERAVASFLHTRTTRSTRPGVHDDPGDIILGGWVVECKDRARWEIPRWWAETAAKAAACGARPMLILKRRQRPTGDGIVVVAARDAAALITGSTKPVHVAGRSRSRRGLAAEFASVEASAGMSVAMVRVDVGDSTLAAMRLSDVANMLA